jgi:hypothetical protein
MDKEINLENFLLAIGEKNAHGIIDFSQKFPALVFFFNEKGDTRYRGFIRFVYVCSNRLLMITADRLSVLKDSNWEDINLENYYIEIPIALAEISIEEEDLPRLYRIRSPLRSRHLLISI